MVNKLPGYILVLSLLLVLLIAGLFVSFSKEYRLSRYAAEAKQATKAGNVTVQYVSSSTGLNPLQRLAQHYNQLLNNWHYQADKKGLDHFQVVEKLLVSKHPKGDCEDFAACMMSIANSLKLQSRICLGESKNGKGHAWTEVLLYSKGYSLPKEMANELKYFGDNAELYFDGKSFWLRLNPKSSLKSFSPIYYIGNEGSLSVANE